MNARITMKQIKVAKQTREVTPISEKISKLDDDNYMERKSSFELQNKQNLNSSLQQVDQNIQMD